MSNEGYGTDSTKQRYSLITFINDYKRLQASPNE